MISVSEEFIYNIINENLDILITEDIITTYNNIKQLTILTNIYVQELYDFTIQYVLIDESSFLELMGTYFTDTVSSQIGRLIQLIFVGSDLAIGAITSGSISSASTTFLTTGLTKLGIEFGVASAFSSVSVALGPLILLVLGFAYYKYIKLDDVKNVKNMANAITKISNILQINLPDEIVQKYKSLLQNNCVDIKKKEHRIECAINGYIQFLNNDIIKLIIISYIKYLKTNNENISNINSFTELMKYNCKTNSSLSKLNNQFLVSYISFLKNIKKNDKIVGDSFLLLNEITKTHLLRNN